MLYSSKQLVEPMRTLPAIIMALLLLEGCATYRHADRDRRVAQAFYCVPGSALRRKVPDGAAYPGWMLLKKGTCKHR